MKIWKIADKLSTNDIVSDSKFLSWFQGSKVVDEKGNPKRVFHGTNQNFPQFVHKYKGRNTQTVSSKMGFFFTEDITEAKDYADLSAKYQITDREFVEKKEKEYLRRIENAERVGNFDLSEKLIIEMEDLSLGKIREEPSGQRIVAVYLKALNPLVINNPMPYVNDCIRQAIKQGNDSVQFLGISDNPFCFQKEAPRTNQWVVFSPKQIWISDNNFSILQGRHENT